MWHIRENLTTIRTLVFSAVILLIGGTLFLMGLTWKRVTTDVDPRLSGNCLGGVVDLKGRGMVVDTTVDGQIMRVSLEKREGKNETVLIDMCSGRVINNLTIEADKAIATE